MKRSFVANESGIALVTAVLVLMVASALMAGMFAALLADQRSHATDRDQSVAYAAAHAGLEKLTASLAGLFNTDFSPSAAQVAAIATTPPTISGFEYTSPGGAAGSGYAITFTADAQGNPAAFANTDITTGPFEGFKGLVTPYTITVTAKSTTGNSEVRLRRELQTVAVPVFQFGIFGEESLGFHAGPNFDFGGRVHTNQTLYLANGTGATLTFRDKITAFVSVVRSTLSNGRSVTLTNHMGNVSIPKVIGGLASDYRLLKYTGPDEGSGTTAAPYAGWKNLSEVTYHTNIRTEATGAKQLNLPLVSAGALPIDLLRRPKVLSAENTANPFLYGQRYFSQASVRILISDRSTDLTDLPTITAGAPVDLANLAASGYVVAAGSKAPVAVSPGEQEAGGMYTRATGVGGTITIQTATTSNFAGGTTTNAVPAWMKWQTMTIGGVAVPCGGLTATQLSACTAHVAYAINSVVTITAPDGTITTATVNPAAAANNATVTLINFNGAAASTAQRFVGTRTFFVGEDPTTCTGFGGAAGVTTTLTGCTYPAGSSQSNNDPVYSGATTTTGTSLLHGFIKIEKQNAAGVWSDITMEILNLGFAAANQQGVICSDPTPNAVIRLERLRDNGMTTATACDAGVTTSYRNSVTATDYWPNTIYDAREASSRTKTSADPLSAGGVLSYAALDINNFNRWLAGTIGTTGTLALNNNGYIVYFSDRRGDHRQPGDTAWAGEDLTTNPETGEYGNEDSINPAAAAWAKNNVLDAGEDFNENGILDVYGETPHALVGYATANAGQGFDSTSRPWTTIPFKYSGRGRLARPVLFRRALKIINGGIVGGVNRVPAAGFAVASENPVYIQGNFNATSTDPTAEPNSATAVLADSITLLSNAFVDSSTFVNPNNSGGRVASDTAYRFAMVTGKTIPFPKPAAWGVEEMGSDGGVHNFMKMLENWGGFNLRYRGSMVSLFYSRQAIGLYRADGDIYGAPTRGYNFDTDFLTPALLPPGTPMFRDINTLKFRQILRPNQ